VTNIELCNNLLAIKHFFLNYCTSIQSYVISFSHFGTSKADLYTRIIAVFRCFAIANRGTASTTLLNIKASSVTSTSWTICNPAHHS